MTAVHVSPGLLRWACARSRIDPLTLRRRFRDVEAWERGEKQPTLKQLESFARATHVPFGYLFLPEPPDEPLPLADFREKAPGPPSGDLLDTIYAVQRRQDWFAEYARTERLEPVTWVGSATLTTSPAMTAARLRTMLGFESEARRAFAGWEAATKALVERLQAAGVLVSVNGVVGASTRRKLDPTEFRGVSLVDELAPCIFINGADHKAAHAFTLCHELAHLTLARPGLSNEHVGERRHEQVEAWCDAVASEFLAPSEQVTVVRDDAGAERAARDLTRAWRVSPLVAVRRIAERADRPEQVLARRYDAALAALPAPRRGGGGDYCAMALKRVGHRFAREIIASTLEGTTTYSESFHLLGVRRSATFEELARRVGLAS